MSKKTFQPCMTSLIRTVNKCSAAPQYIALAQLTIFSEGFHQIYFYISPRCVALSKKYKYLEKLTPVLIVSS